MFYLIRSEYVGPNADQHRGALGHYLTITDQPGRTNMGGAIRTHGWLGTTNDWYEAAEGEFATLESAERAADNLGYTVEIEPPYGCDGADTFSAFRATPYAAQAHLEAADWFSEVTAADLGVTADTTDEQLATIAASEDAQAEGYRDSDTRYGVTLHGTEKYLRSLRDELREDA